MWFPVMLCRLDAARTDEGGRARQTAGVLETGGPAENRIREPNPRGS